MTHPLLTIRSALKRCYAHEMAGVLSRWQLTGMELDVLLFLGNNPDCDTASDMVQLRQLTKSHVSKAVEHLTALGLIRRLSLGKKRAVYEYVRREHSHFVCSRCGGIFDIPADFSGMVGEAARVGGNQVLFCEVTAHGVCQACLKQEHQENAS